jgi:hypothetical protein
VQDYLNYRENPNYLSALHVMEQLQIADEKNTLVQLANKRRTAHYFSQVQAPMSHRSF